MVFLHQALGKGLAGLDDSRLFVWAESGNPLLFQQIHQAHGQGIVGGYHHIVHPVFRRPVSNCLHIGGFDGHTSGIISDTRVAWGGIEPSDLRTFLQLADDGVLPASAADH